MTGNGASESTDPVSGPRPSHGDSAQALRLGVERPRITRLSRKVLAGGTALALLLISGAVLWALRSNQPRNPAPDELYSTEHRNVADGLTTLPHDYAGISRDVPRLGPPLPGDLGRPTATAEGQSVSERAGCRTTACQSGDRGGPDQQSICANYCARHAATCPIPGNGEQHCVIF